jgi:heme/copper-type cytochrome/quinol oxidase subunit 2
MALEPTPSAWSATFSFHTEAAPPPPAQSAPQQGTPLWAWVVIAIGLALLIVVIVFIFRARRDKNLTKT